MSRYAWSAERWHFLMSEDGDTGEFFPRPGGDFNFHTQPGNTGMSAWIFMNKKDVQKLKSQRHKQQEEQTENARLSTTLLECLAIFTTRLKTEGSPCFGQLVCKFETC